MKYFAGIDCSSKAIHVVLLNSNQKVLHLKKWEDDSGDMDNRFINLIIKFQKEFPVFYNNCIGIIESAIYISNLKSTVSIAQVIAGVKLVYAWNNNIFFTVDNKAWKKSCLSDGNANKEKIMKFAIAKWGNIFPEQDFADAACIALWGIQKIGR